MGPASGQGMGPCGAGMAWRRFGWNRSYTKKEEKEVLKEEAKALEEELKAIKERLSQLKDK